MAGGARTFSMRRMNADPVDPWFNLSDGLAGDGVLDELPFLVSRHTPELVFELFVQGVVGDFPLHFMP